MRKFELLAASAIALFAVAPAYAQTAPAADTPAADESVSTDDADIVVTATKREQTLQDVPISVAVASSDTVEKARIVDLKDLGSVVPSLKVTQFQSAGQTNFTIRGFGNGNGNDGIESSVGVFIDGVYRSRSAASLDDLPEIERIEVLRGPQSTLFGKNVSAGAISIVTKRPQFEWGGKAEVTIGNFGLINPRATITGPITDSLAFRLSGSVNERDGYFKNATSGQTINDKHRWSIRGDLLFQPSADFSVRLLADYALIKEVCCGATSIYNGPASAAIRAIGGQVPDDTRIYDRNLVYDTTPSNRLQNWGVSGEVDWNLKFAKLTSITAYRHSVNQTALDVDFTSARISSLTSGNDISTFTQEIRLNGEIGDRFTWLVGGFYEDEKLTTGRDIVYGRDARAYVNLLTGQTPTTPSLITVLESLQAAAGDTTITPGATYFAAGTGISDHWALKQTSYSLFGQADFKVTDRLTLTGGIAYLNDRKAATSNVVLTDRFAQLNLENIPRLGFLPFAATGTLGSCLLQKGFNPASTGGQVPVNFFGASLGASLPGPGSAPCPSSLPGVNPFALNAAQFYYGDVFSTTALSHGPVNIPNANETGILTGDKVTWAARIAYDFGAVNAYFSYSTGWKAGAYNLSSDSRPPNSNGVGRSANPENVEVFELGFKAKFRGGFANLALFKQTIKGFQTNAFTGLGFNLLNAGQESVRGIEFDSGYRVTPWFSVTGAVTYLDPKYDSFTGAACVSYDTVRCPVSPITGRIPNTRDLSGQKPAGIPEWSATVTGTLTHNFGRVNAYLRGEWDYSSKIQLTETTPLTIGGRDVGVNEVSLVNASLGFANIVPHTELMFWVRNLTNDNFLLGAFPSVAQTGSYSGYPNEPRTFGGTVRFTF